MKKALAISFGVIMTGSAFANFVTVDWDNSRAYLLADNMTSTLSSFSIDPFANGVASNGENIWVGSFTTRTITRFSLSGEVLSSFTAATDFGSIQGMAMISPTDIAVTKGSSIRVYDAFTGEFKSSFNGVSTSTEGLAFDAGTLWHLDDKNIVQTDLAGNVLSTIPNYFQGEAFQGTGIAVSGANELTLAARSGRWARINKSDGSLVTDGNIEGNNGIQMYDLAKVEAVPEPATIVALASAFGLSLARRRRNAA